MVIKRSCSFCAGEIEPGTGTMFVKRDGTVFTFCSSSCRKQQLHLGRVGHRLKWTRAHAIKRAAEQAGPRAPSGVPGKKGRSAPVAAPKTAPVPPPTQSHASTPPAPAPKEAAPAAAPVTPAPAKKARKPKAESKPSS